MKEGAGVAAEFHVLALRYWKWGNVPEKTRNEFHAKDATIAKRYRPVGPAFALIYRTPTQVLGSAFRPPPLHRALLFNPTLATL